MNDSLADLRERWLPSERQMQQAGEVLKGDLLDGPVLTIHVLVNKRFGFWSKEVRIRHIEGIVFLDRARALAALQGITHEVHVQTGLPCTGGYSYHWSVEDAAVFEDILARFPEA